MNKEYKSVIAIWKHLSKIRRYQFMMLCILVIFTSILEALGIGSILPLLTILTNPEQAFSDKLFHFHAGFLGIRDSHELIKLATILFISITLLLGGFRIVVLWTQLRLANAVGADLSIEMYRRSLYQPYETHISRNSSEMIAGISTKANALVDSAIMPALMMVSSITILTLIIGMLFYIQPAVAISSIFIFGSIYSLIIISAKSIIRSDSDRIGKESVMVIKALQEGFGGIRDILIDSTQEFYVSIYQSASVPLRRSLANIQIVAASPRFIIESIGMSLIAIAAYYLTVNEGGLIAAIPIMATMALSAQRILPVLQQIYNSLTTIRGGASSVEDALFLLSQPIATVEFENDLRKEIAFNKHINLNNVSFKYREGNDYVIKNINLQIKKGSQIGIIGSTGSGKSTLADIIMGLLLPSEGNLEIDDYIISQSNRKSWQSHIAHVPQSIYLIDATIAENIAYGKTFDQIDFNKLENACAKAKISEFINSLPLKYQTTVGEQGVRLSGGQRQRIGLARAFYKNCDVIILDEATSALDNTTEADVMDQVKLLSENITLIIIAHRYSTLRSCEKIYELKNGYISKPLIYDDIIGLQ